MNNSIIVQFLSKIYLFFASAYESSMFKKMTLAVTAFLKKITANSFFVNFFSTPADRNHARASKILLLFKKIVLWIRKILSVVAAPVAKSKTYNAAGRFYENILNYPIQLYAITISVATVIYSVYTIICGGMTNIMSMVAIVFLVITAFLGLSSDSLYNLFSGSIAVRGLSKLLTGDVFEEKEVFPLTYSSIRTSVLWGVAIAVFSIITHPLYAIVFVVAAALLGWILYDYTVGIYAAVVILPFAPTMALVGLIMFTFMSFVLRFIFDSDMTFTRTPLDVPLLLFGCVLLVSAATSFAVKSSVMAVMVYVAFILSYYLLTNSVNSKKRFCSLIVLMIFAGVIVGAYGIYQHIFGFADGKVWTDTDMFSDIETRVVSTFENPNVLGEYLLLLIPVGIAIVWGSKKFSNKLLYIAAVGVLSLCMVYTYSRGNWIGLLVAVFAFFMFFDRSFVWVGVAALLLSPLFLPQNVINRFLSVGDMGDTSTSYRVYIWMGTLNMLKDYWFSGIGIGTEAFNKIYPLYAYSGVMAPHSHNLYLHILTENGIAGLIVFASVMIVYFKMCISSIVAAKDRLLKAITTGLAAGMLGYLVQGMFDNVWYNYRVFLLFYVILGITSVCVKLSEKTEVGK